MNGLDCMLMRCHGQICCRISSTLLTLLGRAASEAHRRHLEADILLNDGEGTRVLFLIHHDTLGSHQRFRNAIGHVIEDVE